MRDIILYEVFEEPLPKEYTENYKAFRRRKKRKILKRIYKDSLNYRSIIVKHLIEDVVFDNYLSSDDS